MVVIGSDDYSQCLQANQTSLKASLINHCGKLVWLVNMTPIWKIENSQNSITFSNLEFGTHCQRMAVNTPFIVIGSIISCLALGCILKSRVEKRNKKLRVDADYFTLKEEREKKVQHLREHYRPVGRHTYDSVSITNPGLICTVVPI